MKPRQYNWKKEWRAARSPKPTSGLTACNLEVLRALGFGMNSKEISQVTGKTVKTVDYHVGFMCKRLNVDLHYLRRLAWAFGLAPLAAWLMLLAGCVSKNVQNIPENIPPSPPMPRANLRAAPLVTAAPAPGSVTLAWDPSPSSGVGGYRLYQGVKSRTYTVTMTLGNITNATIGAIPGVTNFFAVTALGYSGGTVGESPFSNEAVYSAPVKKKLAALIVSYVETSTNNVFSSWSTLATYTNSFTDLPDPSFFRTRLTIEVTNSP